MNDGVPLLKIVRKLWEQMETFVTSISLQQGPFLRSHRSDRCRVLGSSVALPGKHKVDLSEQERSLVSAVAIE